MPALANDPAAVGLPNGTPFRVWIRPMGQSWKLRVEQKEYAEWLVARLNNEKYQSTAIEAVEESDHFRFICLTKTHAEKSSVEQLLIRWPEVQIQLSPDSSIGNSVKTFSRHGQAPLNRTVQTKPDDVAPFKVWIRPMGISWKIRAEGIAGSGWLYNELLHRGLDCTAPFDVSGTGLFVFRCMSVTAHQKDYVEQLLTGLPQVLLQNDPA